MFFFCQNRTIRIFSMSCIHILFSLGDWLPPKSENNKLKLRCHFAIEILAVDDLTSNTIILNLIKKVFHFVFHDSNEEQKLCQILTRLAWHKFHNSRDGHIWLFRNVCSKRFQHYVSFNQGIVPACSIRNSLECYNHIIKSTGGQRFWTSPRSEMNTDNSNCLL